MSATRKPAPPHPAAALAAGIVRRAGPGRRPGKASGPAQRERLLDVALDLFARRGVVNTTLGEIARAAGVTPAMVHYYFNSREQLLDVLVEERLDPIRERMIASLAGTEDPVELLVGMARAMVKIAGEHHWYAPLWMREVVSEGGGLRDTLERRHGRGPIEDFVGRLRRAQQAGRLNPALEPELVVLSLMGLTLLPLARLRATGARGISGLTAEKIERHAAALLLGGVAAPART
jgi:AcrR family transcriptional regulator